MADFPKDQIITVKSSYDEGKTMVVAFYCNNQKPWVVGVGFTGKPLNEEALDVLLIKAKAKNPCLDTKQTLASR